MKSHVAIYKTHDQALKAVRALNASGFPIDNVSLVGKADYMDDNIKVRSIELYKLSPVFIFIGAGIITALLAGAGVVHIPGFEYMEGTSQLINGILGFNFGLLIGGMLTITLAIFFKDDKIVSYKEHLLEQRFLVIVNGTIEEIQSAEHILHTEGTHLKVA